MRFIYEIGNVTIIITEQHFIDTKPVKVQYAWEVWVSNGRTNGRKSVWQCSLAKKDPQAFKTFTSCLLAAVKASNCLIANWGNEA